MIQMAQLKDSLTKQRSNDETVITLTEPLVFLAVLFSPAFRASWGVSKSSVFPSWW
jgi:hypothetical protein